MTTDDLSIRPRSEGDLAEIVGWVADAEELFQFAGPRAQWPLTTAQLRAMADAPNLEPSVVVDASGGLVAHFDLTVDGKAARLGKVIVKPELRGHGVAGSAMKLALARARERGAGTVRLYVGGGNEAAIAAYQRAGFSILSGIPGHEHGRVVIMEQVLPSD